MNRFKYYKPKSLDEVWELKKKIPDSLFIAGGTDVLVGIKNNEIRPQALISLRSIPGFSNIDTGKVTRIGALATISDIIQNPELKKDFPVLVEAAKSLGSAQIRNVATIGGNLCNGSPCADLALPLLVMEAKVRLQTVKNKREIPIDKFFKGPGESCLASHEILTDILLDPPQKNAKTSFIKKGRVKMDLAVASVAVLLEMEGNRCRKARIAAGSVAPVPLRLSKVETMFEGATITKKHVADAQQLAEENVAPITDVRSTEEYRRQITGMLVKRAVERALEWSQA
ncbi:MAG: xanthine dehydrogenase family protein subunit M [Candidatus Aminicenantes bacterium]|jgi:carbon-monoxide dehydrogenase medium subunit